MFGEARGLCGVVALDRSIRVGTKEVDVGHQALHFNVSTKSKARACVSDTEIGAAGRTAPQSARMSTDSLCSQFPLGLTR